MSTPSSEVKKVDPFAFQANAVRACGLSQMDLIRFEVEQTTKGKGAKTMEAKFTKGPWDVFAPKVDKERLEIMHNEAGVIEIGDEMNCIALVPAMHPEAEANARLIAAAPELLEALNLARIELDFVAVELMERGAEQQARNAAERAADCLEVIRKARGAA